MKRHITKSASSHLEDRLVRPSCLREGVKPAWARVRAAEELLQVPGCPEEEARQDQTQVPAPRPALDPAQGSGLPAGMASFNEERGPHWSPMRASKIPMARVTNTKKKNRQTNRPFAKHGSHP